MVGSSKAPGLSVCPRVGDSSMEMRHEERNRLCVVSADVLGLFQTCEFTPRTNECPLVTQSDSSFSLSSQHLSFTFWWSSDVGFEGQMRRDQRSQRSLAENFFLRRLRTGSC